MDCRVVNLLEPEELALAVRVVLAVPEDAFEREGLIALAVSLDPEVFVESLDGGLYQGEKLILALLALSEPDLLALLVEHKSGDAVDNLVVVLAETNLLNHEDLSIVLGVGLGSD